MTATNDNQPTFRAVDPPDPPFWSIIRPVSKTMQPIVTTELAYVIYQLPNREKDR